MKRILFIGMLFLFVSTVLANGQTVSCSLTPSTPGPVQLNACSLSTTSVTVTLQNTGTVGFFVDSVRIRASGGGPDGCPGCLNDGFLVTQLFNVPVGDFIPAGGSHNAILEFNPYGVSYDAAGMRCGNVIYYVSSGAQESQCFFNICADVVAPPDNCFTRTDLSRDGSLSSIDLAMIQSHVYGTFPLPSCGYSTIGDLNLDGFRDATDVVQAFYNVWVGDTCKNLGHRPLIPDQRDSIIIESKVVNPSNGPLALAVTVWITNKDSLAGVALPLLEIVNSGDAYATLARPRSSAVVSLNSTLGVGFNNQFPQYHSNSPDSLIIFADDIFGGPEPPNSTRKPFWEIRFDSVTGTFGQILLDSIGKYFASGSNVTTQFVDAQGRRVPVNFKPGLVTVVGSHPVVLLHGYNSDPSIWDFFVQLLQNSGFTHIWVANNLLPCGGNPETNFSVNAESLSAFIERQVQILQIQTGYEADTIDIIAHSMGGLISRRYSSPQSTEPWARKRKVKHLIMLGTPNGGTNLGNVACKIDALFPNRPPGVNCKPGSAECELGWWHMMLSFNVLYPIDPNTSHYIAAGYRGRRGGGCGKKDKDCIPKSTMFEECPNDGIVHAAGAEYLPPPGTYKGMMRDNWCHGDYYRDAGVFNSFILPILKGQLLSEKPSFAASNAADDSSTPPQLSYQTCDSIMLSQSRTDTLNVEGGALSVLILITDQMLTYTLESPGGMIWDSASAAMDTNVTYITDTGERSFLFENAEPGTWLIHYDAQNLSVSPAGFCLHVAQDNTVILRSDINEQYPLPGTPIMLTATLTDNLAPITGAMVTALPIHERTDTLSIFSLFDDGSHNDGAAGDGVYGGVFNQATDSGLIVFELTATGTASSVGSFRREATLGAYITLGIPMRGDLNRDGQLTPSDVVLELTCVFLGQGDCLLEVADVNCDGILTPADVVLELQAVFAGLPFSC